MPTLQLATNQAPCEPEPAESIRTAIEEGEHAIARARRRRDQQQREATRASAALQRARIALRRALSGR